MKPRTSFQRKVVTANGRLQPIAQRQIDWAYRKLAPHFSFRTRGKENVCSDCGESFIYEGKGKNAKVRCPHCGSILNVKDTRKQKESSKTFFSTLEVIDAMQVQRVFALYATYHKGVAPEVSTLEVLRVWHDGKGHRAVTARRKQMGYYIDNFICSSKIELRNGNASYDSILDTYVVPGAKILPIYRTRGVTGRFPNVSPDRLFTRLLTDPRIETILKAGRTRDLDFFLSKGYELDKVWQSYRITLRRGYGISDISIWVDLVNALNRCGKDVRNFKYVCPDNLKMAHDYWVRRMAKMIKEENYRRERERAKKEEADFFRLKSKFFDLTITDGEIEITVLDSIQSFIDEGEAMHHCVFANRYYAHEDSLIMSARINGERIETIELSLSSLKILQSRAVCNGLSPYHDRIISLVNSNLNEITKRISA